MNDGEEIPDRHVHTYKKDVASMTMSRKFHDNYRIFRNDLRQYPSNFVYRVRMITEMKLPRKHHDVSAVRIITMFY